MDSSNINYRASRKLIIINMGNRFAPKTGPKAYYYNDSSTDNFIGKGGFSNVFRAIRYYDQQTFAIKVA